MTEPDLSVAVPSARATGTPSRALLVAALGGLLAATCATGCADDERSPVPGGASSTGATITSARTDASITLESFSKECAARNGTLEIHPHCGGANSCKGISYDAGTHVYSEHTCAGLNTCNGFSCVDPKGS